MLLSSDVLASLDIAQIKSTAIKMRFGADRDAGEFWFRDSF